MHENLSKKAEDIHKSAQEHIEHATDPKTLEEVRVTYLGRKSELNEILKSIKDLSNEEKKQIGSLANFIRKDIEKRMAAKEEELRAQKLSQIDQENIDVSSPINPANKEAAVPVQEIGHVHPLEIARREAEQIFMSMGFSITKSPELESDYYNFESLNIPQGHPARDIWDTFWTTDNMVLRTHTSAFQMREIDKVKHEASIDLRALNIGRCYRNEATDARHDHTFYQMDGVVVDKTSTVQDLIYTLRSFFSAFYKSDVAVQMIPGYFPFVEPGFEMAITCVICKGKNPHCPTCSGSGWLEILGCGMIHPNILTQAGIDTTIYSGYAFGMGFDRLAMIKYGIDDIRHFNTADLRLLEQFS